MKTAPRRKHGRIGRNLAFSFRRTGWTEGKGYQEKRVKMIPCRKTRLLFMSNARHTLPSSSCTIRYYSYECCSQMNADENVQWRHTLGLIRENSWREKNRRPTKNIYDKLSDHDLMKE